MDKYLQLNVALAVTDMQGTPARHFSDVTVGRVTSEQVSSVYEKSGLTNDEQEKHLKPGNKEK